MSIKANVPTRAKRFHTGAVFFVLLPLFLCLHLIACTATGTQQISADVPPQNLPPSTAPSLYLKELPPFEPQPRKDALKPGLAATYFYKYFHRHLDFLTKNDPEVIRKGKPGNPLPLLNHHFGRTDYIFDSGSFQGVAMRIKGFIHFPKTGEYTFQAVSNDGLAVYLNGKLMINDPAQHSDRLSNLAVVEVAASGWYPLMVEYFQRKGTATLKLYWRQPGHAALVIVPATVYAHIPDA